MYVCICSEFFNKAGIAVFLQKVFHDLEYYTLMY